MKPSELINEVRELIGKARLEKALEQLLPWLETAEEKTSSWADTVRGLLSRYQTLKLSQQQNIISSEKADLTRSQITNSLLDILSSIEQGETAPEQEKSGGTKRTNTPWMTIGIILALVLATASFFMLRKENTPTVPPPDVDIKDSTAVVGDAAKCPKFKKASVFNIMVLPYQPLGGKRKDIDKGLRIRLSNMMDEYSINGSIMRKNLDVTSPDYPITANQVIPIAKPCKAQLVIWGFTEEIGDKITTITNFRFLDKDHFALTGLELNQVDTISSISSIATSQELTENIEESIKLIFGLVALETNHYAAATELLEETVKNRGGAAAVPGWGMLLAESKIKNNEHQAAMAVYDQILKKDNNNTMALTQKGILAFNAGDYNLAVESLSPVLEKEPDNKKARAARAAAYVYSNDLYQASVDLEKIEQSPQKSTESASALRKEYNSRHDLEVSKKTKAGKTLETNPKDTAALRVQAQTARNLGEFELANKAASNLLATDPKNMAALTTLMEIKPMVRNPEALQAVIQRAQQQISPNRIQMMKPRIILENGGRN